MKKNKKLISILSVAVLLLILGVSYAYFGYYKRGTYAISFDGGKLDVLFTSITGNNVLVEGMYPQTDEDGLEKGITYEFNITGYNESNKDIHYRIYMEDFSDIEGKTRFNDSDIRLAVYKDGEMVLEPSTIEDFDNPGVYFDVIPSGISHDNSITESYVIKLWIGSNVKVTDTSCEEGDNCYSQNDFKNMYFSKILKVEADFSYDDLGYLTYNTNGGVNQPKKTSVTAQTITLEKPVKENMGFLGWSSDPLATEPEYLSGDTYTGGGKVLYAIYGSIQNVMNVFSSTITEQKEKITQVYFESDNIENINEQYNAATIKADLTYNDQGRVLGWLEENATNSDEYSLYVGSEGATYFNTGDSLLAEFTNLKTIELNNVDTSMVTNMSSMFYKCESLSAIDVSGFNTTNVTDMRRMFYEVKNVNELDLSNFDATNVSDMSEMFYNAYNLRKIKTPINISDDVILDNITVQTYYDNDNGIDYAIGSFPNNIENSVLLDVELIIPTTPVLAGGTTKWTNVDSIVTIETLSTSEIGIKEYQFYASTSNSELVGGEWITSDSITISKEGAYYVYARAIGNNNASSELSEPVLVKIDKTAPLLDIGIETIDCSTSPSIDDFSTSIDVTVEEEIVKYGVTYSDNNEFVELIIKLEQTEKVVLGGTVLVYYTAVDEAGNKSETLIRTLEYPVFAC